MKGMAMKDMVLNLRRRAPRRRLQDSLKCLNQAISLWEQLLKAGQTQVTSILLLGLKYRFELFRECQAWKAASADVVQVLRYALPMLQADPPSEDLVENFRNFLKLLRALSQGQRNLLFAALGENAAQVRQLLAEG
jgi:hypothetical protein